MSGIEGPVQEHLALSPRRSANGRTPTGFRVLHVVVPEQIFNHVKIQSLLSGLRFPDYVARFLQEAWPYQDSRSPPLEVSSQVPTSVNVAESEQ